jgi:predicted protein tyrosine phosphatase/diadenosine tetraphosphate (Ap4A) HIT family hydrolase
MNIKTHLLFICTANVCRSPLAAAMFNNSPVYEAKSAGTHIQNEYHDSVSVNQELIDWADEILVMSESEDHHLSYLKENFSIVDKKITVLDIPNIFDVSIPQQKEELTKILKEKLGTYLNDTIKYEDFLKNMKGCPFCGEVSRIITETEFSFMTYALWPYHKHHLLVIPKRHVESLTEITETERNDINGLQEKALEILKKIGYTSITQLVREGNVVNKAVNHVHFHTIPNIRIGDLDHNGENRKMLSENDIGLVVDEIRKYI